MNGLVVTDRIHAVAFAQVEAVTTTDYPDRPARTMIRALRREVTAPTSDDAPTITRRIHTDTSLAWGAQDQGEGDTTMENGGARDNEQEAETHSPMRALAAILDHHAAKTPAPRPETDRRTNYRRPPVPPGLNLTAASIEEAVFRDPAVIEHAHEVAHATAQDHATDRRTILIDAKSGRELLDYFDSRRPTLPAELRARVDATLDRHLRQALQASTRTRLECPFCGGRTVVPTPDLKSLLCLDYECAPNQPRRIDPAYAQEPERRITAKQLALLAGEEDDAAMRKRLWRAKIQPVHTGPHGKHEYLWADVAHLVGPKLPAAPPPAAPAANRDGRTGLISGSVRRAAAA